MAHLRQRLQDVRQRIERAAARAGRNADGITLLAVTKKFPASIIEEAYALGLREFGENYVQEFQGKRSQLPVMPDARFHLIGHLQSNKAAAAAELFQVIQTVDTVRLIGRLAAAGARLECLIEVKLSEEEAKSGAPPEAIAGLIAEARRHSTLELTGLMTIPPWSQDAERSRPYFVKLRQLAEEHGLRRLSMGMSNDLEVAIEEGATCVRVGTALFGPRPKPV